MDGETQMSYRLVIRDVDADETLACVNSADLALLQARAAKVADAENGIVAEIYSTEAEQIVERVA